MKKISCILASFLTIVILSSVSFSFSSCTKDRFIHDTTIIKDTIIKTDTITKVDTFSAWKEIGKHINDSLWAYYPINGSVADSSGNGHVLEIIKSAGFTHDMWGNKNSALNLDGDTAYGIIPDGKLFNNSSFSISMFVLPRELSGLLIGKQDYSNGKGASFNVGFDNIFDGERLRYAVAKNQVNICNEEANGAYKCTKPDLLTKYAWYHVVITYRGNLMKLYVNGILVETTENAAGSINFCSTAPFVLGSWWSGDQKLFNGKMDKIRIYYRTLRDNEVDYLFKKN
jgi:hypothetical protein